jgi:hypothetical protein
MNLVGGVQSAISGWFDIFARRQEWQKHFDLSLAGLVNALEVYGFVALACIFAGQAASSGLPSPVTLIVRLLILSLPLVSLTASVYLTRAILRFTAPPMALIVPAIYALAAYLIAGTVLNLAGPAFPPLMLVLVGAMLYCEARIVANLSLTNGVAFALLTLVLLVALPASLYMLAAPGAGTI